MFKNFIFIVFLLSANDLLSCDLFEHEKSGEIICQLEKDGQEVALYYFKEACEFPEGNMNKCIYSVACKNNRNYRGLRIFNGKKSLEALCLTSDKGKNNSIKNLFSHSQNDISVDLDCSTIHDNPEIKLSISNKHQNCKIGKYLK